MDQYQVLKTLKSALYGDVVLARCKLSQKLVAIKRVKLANALRKQSINGNKIKEDAEFEKNVMKLLNSKGGHSNVLKLEKEFVESGVMYLVLEYCEKGELYGLIEEAQDQRFDEEQAKLWFHQIVSGVRFIHSMGVAHRDISLENVLVDGNDVCKVCDFGLSADANLVHRDSVGKFFYMAPEVYSNEEYNPVAADVWSLGIVLFIMLTGFPPTEVPSVQDDRFRLIKNKGAKALLRAWKMDAWISSDAADLLESILIVNPNDRPSIAKIMSHPWFKSLEVSSEEQQSCEIIPMFVSEEDDVVNAISTVTINNEHHIAKKTKVLRNIQREKPKDKASFYAQVTKQDDVRRSSVSAAKCNEMSTKSQRQVANPTVSTSLLNINVFDSLRERVENNKLWQRRSLLKEAWKSSCPWNPIA